MTSTTPPRRRNRRTRAFKKLFDKLPTSVQAIAEAVFKRFCADPTFPALDNRALKDTAKGQHRCGSFKVSITQRYRAIYVVDEPSNTNVWYWIGSHEDYNSFTGNL